MRSSAAFILAVFFIVIQMFFISGCTQTVSSPSDELIMSSWSLNDDKGNDIKLTFSDDSAAFSVNCDNKSTSVNISGFCELSQDSFVIHDNATGVVFAFRYKLHFDSIDLSYDNGTVRLNKVTDN